MRQITSITLKWAGVAFGFPNKAGVAILRSPEGGVTRGEVRTGGNRAELRSYRGNFSVRLGGMLRICSKLRIRALVSEPTSESIR